MTTAIRHALFLMLAMLPLLVHAQEKGAVPEKKADPAMAKITDDPKLPRVLLIGDSISIGYTIPVREMLAGKANVHRILTNGGPTSNGIMNIDAWLAEGKWDVIHFNFGLHDLKIMKDDKHQVSLADYEANLKTIAEKLQKTGAKVIWATTTPVPEGKVSPVRRPADVIAFNEAAARVMKEKNIPTDDLYNAVLPQLAELQTPVNVHFKPAGYKALAVQVVKSIEAALAK